MNYHLLKLIFLFTVFIFLVSCKTSVKPDEKSEKPKSSSQPAVVKAIVIKPEPFPVQSITNGKIHATSKVDLYFSKEGVIDNIYFKNGDFVAKGDLIASLESEMAKIELARAEEAVSSAKTELSSLLLGYGGNEDDTTSVNNLLLQKLKSQSGYTMALLNLKAARLNYENNFIYAPFNAIIEGLNYQKYNKINPSDKFCTLLSDKDYTVEFKIIESEIDKIKLNSKIDVYKLDDESIKYTAVINEINPAVDKNGLITVKAQLHTAKRSTFIEGMNVKVVINNYLEPCLSVPKSALVLRSGKEVVFTYENGKAKWNYVKTMAENATSFAISEGLNPYDTVIISGALNLAHDAPVKLISIR